MKHNTWIETQKSVKSRDKMDRLLLVITYKEQLFLARKAPHLQLMQLDCAHIIARSSDPKLILEDNNVILLNRYSHEKLDNHLDPITGEPLTEEQHWNWWKRLAGKEIGILIKEGLLINYE